MLFKNQSLKKSLCLLISMCCMLLMVACNNEQGEQEEAIQTTKKKVVGVLVYKKGDLYITAVSDAIKQSLGDDITVILKSAEHDQLTQNEQIDDFIAQKVDGLIINLVDTGVAANISEKTKKANIPIVFFNREPDLSVLNNYDNVYFVGTMAEHAGILQGDIIKKLWNDNPKYDRNNDGIIQYIMIQASPDNAEAVARTEYSIKQATKNELKLQQVGETLMAAWSQDIAKGAIQVIWPNVSNQVELIIANNDAMALGAISLLQDNGYNLEGGNSPYIPVIGVDAIAPAVEAINKGVMSGTVKQDALKMGVVIANVLFKAIDGTPFPLDPDLQLSDNGKIIRIPYKVLY